MLDAIERSGTGKREAVVEALMHTTNRKSILGTYSIDANGDTTLGDYGLYEIDRGRPAFVDKIEVP